MVHQGDEAVQENTTGSAAEPRQHQCQAVRTGQDSNALKELGDHLCIEEVTLRVSARVCTTPWVAKTRLKVKPMADSRTRMGRSLRCTSQPPRPYKANKEQCTAVLNSSALSLAASCSC